MACRYTYEGKTYTHAEFIGVLSGLSPAKAAKYMPDVKSLPDFPFPNTWHEIALKRAIRYAAEKGYDQIAWTSGEMQVDRYNRALRQQVDEIFWVKTPDGIHLVGKKNGTQVVDTTEKETVLSDAIGKTMAERIISNPAQTGRIKGEDITISGTGMAGFYDRKLVNTANALGKKFGSRAAPVKIGLPELEVVKQNAAREYGEGSAAYNQAVKNLTLDVWGMPITDMMKASVMQGQPLFAQELRNDGISYRGKSISPTEFIDLNKKVKALFKQWTGSDDVKLVDVITSNGKPTTLSGAYDAKNGGAQVSLRHAANVFSILGHEAIHALRAMRVITDKEWSLLVDTAKKGTLDGVNIMERVNQLYAEGYRNKFPNLTDAEHQALLEEEAAAFFIGHRLDEGLKVEAPAKTLADRIAQFREALANLFKGYGLRTTGGIISDISGGRMASREPGSGHARPAHMHDVLGAIEQSPAFRKWFGDSKVVNEDGSPKVVYHGTDAVSDFDKFNRRTGDVGIHFGSEGQANDRIEYKGSGNKMPGGGPRVIPVYLSIKNPLRMEDAGAWNADSMIHVLADKFPDSINELLKGRSKWNTHGISTKDIREFLQRQGYDGIVYRNTGETGGSKPYADAARAARQALVASQKERGKSVSGYDVEDQKTQAYKDFSKAENAYRNYRETNAEDSYIAFEPTQIKSVHNSGTFNPNNASILGAESNLPANQSPFAIAKSEDARKGLERLAGNINLYKLNTTADIEKILTETAAKAADFIDARRGVQTHEQTRQLALDSGLTEEQLLKRQRGDAFNAEHIFAARILMMNSLARVEQMAATVANSTSRNDATSLAEFQKVLARHAAIQEQVAGLTAEAGRALNQHKMLADRNYIKSVAEVVDSAVNVNKNRNFGGQTVHGEHAVREIARTITTLKGNKPAINELAKNVYKVTGWDMLRELYINNLLSGMKTLTVNFGANFAFMMKQIPETAAAATVGKFHGGEKVYYREVTARLYGLMAGSVDGIAVAYKTMMTGESAAGVTKIETHSRKAIPNLKIGGRTVLPIGSVIRTPSRFMMATDDLFNIMNYRAELQAQAMRSGISTGLSGKALKDHISAILANPPKDMQDKAHKAALYYTFQNELGPIAKDAMKLRNKIPGAFIVVPFLKTLINLNKAAYEWVPGVSIAPRIGMKEGRDDIMMRNGGAAFDTRVARQIMGVGLTLFVVNLALSGMLSGSGPDDKNKRGAWMANGWMPYSVLRAGQWISYQRWDPFSLFIGVVADMTELGEKLPEADQKTLSALLIKSISRNLLNKTWLQGPANFFQMVTNADQYAERWQNQLVSNFAVPSFVNQISQYEDPYLRDARTLVDSIKARTFYSTELPKRINIIGEPIMREGAVGPDLISPVYVSTEKHNPVLDEMKRLDYYPEMPSRQINGHELTGPQYEEYAAMSGKKAEERLHNHAGKPAWVQRNNDANIKAIKRAFDESRDWARDQMRRKYKELRKKAVK